jgi:hypothetical protein
MRAVLNGHARTLLRARNVTASGRKAASNSLSDVLSVNVFDLLITVNITNNWL